MSVGRTPETDNSLHSTTAYCEATLGSKSIYRFLHDHGEQLFADERFSDLFESTGRASIPPRIVAIVMVLQRLEGLSDREAVERFAFDLRWKYAVGGLSFDYPGFVHTVLVDMRARLRRSQRPDRIFEVVLDVAKRSGLVGHKRVLDSAPLYDAVATQDTVTLIRAAIRGVVRAADDVLAAELREGLKRDDDYERAGKPVCDWEDAQAREALVDALCTDGYAVLARLESRRLSATLQQASTLLATVLGQDIETDETGGFRIARRVAPDRVISTVDPEARHGHKTQARRFDGYKGHISIDPDSEIITATAVTPGNRGDGEVAEELLAEAFQPPAAPAQAVPSPSAPLEVYGDAAYGTGALLATMAKQGAVPYLKVQPPQASKAMFCKDRFVIDLEQQRVTCPAGGTAPIRLRSDGSGTAGFGAQCRGCALRAQCTRCADGRNVTIHAQEALVAQARHQQQNDPVWRERYRSTRPKVERKLAHLVRRKHGGRRARLIGTLRIAWDFALLAAATNLQRMTNLLITPLIPAELLPATG